MYFNPKIWLQFPEYYSAQQIIKALVAGSLLHKPTAFLRATEHLIPIEDGDDRTLEEP
jgi:hypothetical protein